MFSQNAFVLGLLMFFGICLVNLMYIFLCKIWKIKILEFGIFLSPKFRLYSKTINETKLILGWLPLGSYIKPLGMLKEDIVEGKVKASDLPFAFQNKSSLQKLILHRSDLLVWFFILMVSLYAVESSHNMPEQIHAAGSYISKSLHTMFADKTDRAEFAVVTSNALAGKSIVGFAMVILVCYGFVFYPTMWIMTWLANNKKINKAFKFIGFIPILFLLYLCIWKIPSFVLSFFAFGQIMKYIEGFIAGAFATGIIVFGLTLLSAKVFSLFKVKG
jgi:membrane-associated protease RseP (regulator of RpoE activity)